MGLLRLALTFILGPPLFLIAAGCAAAAAGAQQGRQSLRWDILAHFAPLWFAGALAAALVALIALRGLSRLAIFALGVTGMVAAGLLIAPELTRSTGPRAAAGGPGQLKIVQFNVWAHSPDFQSSVDWLVREDPDLAILEETTPEFRQLVLARWRGHVVCGGCEVMILSKTAPVAGAAPKVGARAPGPLTRAVFRDARGSFEVVGVHYSWPTDAGDQQAQERRLAAAIEAVPRERTIAAGDFNSAPWSFSRRRWDATFGLIRRDRALFSWPARQSTRTRWLGAFPFLPIDHVYAGSGWATVSVTRGPKLGSDHFPVVAILAPLAPR
jgi:endonuclease/exonuclease/phosphatase (EEP) superfamily protein YafD